MESEILYVLVLLLYILLPHHNQRISKSQICFLLGLSSIVDSREHISYVEKPHRGLFRMSFSCPPAYCQGQSKQTELRCDNNLRVLYNNCLIRVLNKR